MASTPLFKVDALTAALYKRLNDLRAAGEPETGWPMLAAKRDLRDQLAANLIPRKPVNRTRLTPTEK